MLGQGHALPLHNADPGHTSPTAQSGPRPVTSHCPASVIVSATSQRSLLVTPLRGVTHPTALCAASRYTAQSAAETGYTAERCNQ